MLELRQNILEGIKKKLTGAETMSNSDKELAAGIYVYSIEEFGC